MTSYVYLPRQRPPLIQLALVLALVLTFLVMTACSRPDVKPEATPPAPVQTVKVAVPVPCKVEQVAVPDYPSKQARKGDDIHTLSKIALADRRVRMGENQELRAANNAPCPGGQ